MKLGPWATLVNDATGQPWRCTRSQDEDSCIARACAYGGPKYGWRALYDGELLGTFGTADEAMAAVDAACRHHGDELTD